MIDGELLDCNGESVDENLIWEEELLYNYEVIQLTNDLYIMKYKNI